MGNPLTKLIALTTRKTGGSQEVFLRRFDSVGDVARAFASPEAEPVHDRARAFIGKVFWFLTTGSDRLVEKEPETAGASGSGPGTMQSPGHVGPQPELSHRYSPLTQPEQRQT